MKNTIRIPVLLYHRIDTPPAGKPPHAVFIEPYRFENHLRWLKRLGWQGLYLSDLVDCLDNGTHPDKRSVAICFDDGHRDNLTNALPILKKYQFPATVFVVAGKIGEALHFDYTPPEGDPVLSPDEIREMSENGISIQSHGMTHARLVELTDAEVFREMKDSKEILESIINKKVDLFAYPYGNARPSFELLAKRAGYRAAFSTYRGRDHKPDERYFLKRLSILYSPERKLFKFFDHLVIKSYAKSQWKLDNFLKEVQTAQTDGTISFEDND
ncbi:polysaccharide deacetylase family protein [Candidatus Sumerlaeota bacterium]|nr:polysaccharide deacetylase family protein [Candidatus Sumerlaeota bacterium]